MLRRLEIWGEPEARGRRHGQTLGADIHRLRREILTYLARISLYAGALPLYGLFQWMARGFWPYIPPHLQQEMAAIPQRKLGDSYARLDAMSGAIAAGRLG